MTILVAIIAFGYFLVLLGVYAGQRRLIYPMRGSGIVPNVPAASLEKVDSVDGRTVHTLYARADDGAPTLVHFHGNGEELADLAALVALFRERGLGVLAVEYPGYGLSKSDDPSEQGIYAAAEAALRDLRENKATPPELTVLSGQSLGSGVAVEMAHRGHAGRVVLYSPFTSIADVANVYFPFLPNRWLVKDAYDSASKAPHVNVPVLVVHGTHDEVIPFELGSRLASRFPRGRLIRIERGRHDDLFMVGGNELVSDVERFCRGE